MLAPPKIPIFFFVVWNQSFCRFKVWNQSSSDPPPPPPTIQRISIPWGSEPVHPHRSMDDIKHGFQTRIQQVSGLFDTRSRFGTHSKRSMPIFSSQEAFQSVRTGFWKRECETHTVILVNFESLFFQRIRLPGAVTLD